MKRYGWNIIIVLTVLVLSCETASDIRLRKGATSSVMTSFVYPDSVVTVNVYGTVSVLDTTRVSDLGNGEVRLNVQGESATRYVVDGSHSAKFGYPDVKEGDTVSILAMFGDTEMSAKTYIPTRPEITMIDTMYNTTMDRMYFFIEMSDAPTTPDYYQLILTRKYINEKGHQVKEAIECNYYDYLFYQATIGLTQTFIGLFADETINGQQYTLKLSIPVADIWKDVPEENDVAIDIALYHHTEDYYLYARSVASVESYLLLPVFMSSNVYSNVDGGFGIVSGMSCEVETIVFNRNKTE